jgi:hypothetical protein
MTDSQKYRNLLDGYFEGTLSSSEESTLMQRLKTDAELKSEFDIQNDIINTIRETRQLELKSRLDHIPIRWYHNISNSWKIAATATVITVSTLTAYYFIDQQADIKNRIDLAQNETVLDSYYLENEDIPPRPEAETTKQVSPPQISDIDPILEAKKENTQVEELDQTKTPTTEVIVPDVIEDFEEVDHINIEDVTSGDINTMSPSREDLHSSVEIRSVIHKKFNFHYNFSDGTLTLYGNFEDVPYEILEINSASGKKFYLNYKDNFYSIINTSNIIPLEPVTNESLINELKIVKENK